MDHHRKELLAQVAGAVDTPFYAYDMGLVEAQAANLRSRFPTAVLLYAMKANSLPTVLEIIVAAGFGLECVSLVEVLLAVNLGTRKILYTSSNVSDREFMEVLKLSKEHATAGTATIWINCDSMSRLRKLPHGSGGIWLRVNGPVGGGHHDHVITCGPASKFGVPHEMLGEALQIIQERGIQLVGLHQHIGSGVLDPATYLTAINVLAGMVEQHAHALPHLQFVDFGGGIGVPYRPGQAAVDLDALSRVVHSRFAELCNTVGKAQGKDGPAALTLVLEPGRYLVAEAGSLVVRVNSLKPTPYGRTYAGVDSGFHHLVRPMMYGAYHGITLLEKDGQDGQEGKHEYMIVGNVCESGDVFTPDGPRAFPRPLEEGDLLVIHTAGAYGYAMASEYNLRPKPTEVVIYTGKAASDKAEAVATRTRTQAICTVDRAAVAAVARGAKSATQMLHELLAEG